jgi:hypothetical protein
MPDGTRDRLQLRGNKGSRITRRAFHNLGAVPSHSSTSQTGYDAAVNNRGYCGRQLAAPSPLLLWWKCNAQVDGVEARIPRGAGKWLNNSIDIAPDLCYGEGRAAHYLQGLTLTIRY